MTLTLGAVALTHAVGAERPASEHAIASASLRIVSRVVAREAPALHGALYPERTGRRLLGRSSVSKDNGRSWRPFALAPDFSAGLPHGYRRAPVTSALDRRTGRLITIVNALDTPGLDPRIEEPPIALKTYYLRYRVSADGGRTWLFEEPIVQSGAFTAEHPFDGIRIGKNSLFLGDAGCIPIVTRAGKVLVPAQTTLLGPDGSLANPGGGFTYTDVLVLIGSWTNGSRLKWHASQRVQAGRGRAARGRSPGLGVGRSTRGMIEPTLAEFPDGRLLMVMRGSNGGAADPHYALPSYKWFSVSRDGGATWTNPEPWGYDDGQPFFSPSSMSTLFRHSSGRCFWAGNISPTNCQGNSPRWPLVMGEVDPRSLKLVRESVLTLDAEQPEDRSQGRLDLSHFTLLEDRETKEIVVTYPRAHNAYQSYEWATLRIAVGGR